MVAKECLEFAVATSLALPWLHSLSETRKIVLVLFKSGFLNGAGCIPSNLRTVPLLINKKIGSLKLNWPEDGISTI